MVETPWYNDSNLSDHEVSRREVDEALDDPNACDYPLPPSYDGNDRAMIVGETEDGRLLEIGVEYMPDGGWNIFHGNDAKPKAIELSQYQRTRL